jgi:RND family efflux transporter MFP subunit
VSTGQTLAQVADTDRLIADINLVGPDAARVEPGQEVRLRHHAWEDSTFTGRVIRLAPSVNPTTRTLRVEVEMDNREGRLRPGMFIEATVVAERRPDAVVVPRVAVTERAGRKVLFVLKGQKVELREVGLGLGDDDVVEVRGGIEPGERVVVKGLETLTDGARVRVSGS